MTDEATGYRSKDQVLFDLARAFPFSPEALEANRQGKLAKDQFKQYIGRCTRPTVMGLVCLLAPVLFWTGITKTRMQISFDAAFPEYLNNLIHVNQLIELIGKWSAFAELGSTILFFGIAAFVLSRVSPALYFDILDGTVVAEEGRLIARENQTMRDNGRDPIEKYFFSLKSKYYEVNLAAYRALESGSMYRLYLLPRSDVLVSLEPKLTR
jgi:hypothetical protein